MSLLVSAAICAGVRLPTLLAVLLVVAAGLEALRPPLPNEEIAFPSAPKVFLKNLDKKLTSPPAMSRNRKSDPIRQQRLYWIRF
jgi:hypothetical protein